MSACSSPQMFSQYSLLVGTARLSATDLQSVDVCKFTFALAAGASSRPTSNFLNLHWHNVVSAAPLHAR